MTDLSGASTLKSALLPSSAPTPAKRSINGLALMLSQRDSSTSCTSPAAPRTNAEDTPSPPPSSAAAAVASPLHHAPPSTCAPADEDAGEEARGRKGVGHFSQFRSQDFEPDDAAPFGDEWERLRASQGWVPGSQVYRRERARALRNELRACYFPSSSVHVKEEQRGEFAQSVLKSEERDVSKDDGGGGKDCAGAPPALVREQDADEEESASQAELTGFQAMCTAIGQQPGSTLGECEAALRATLVNIVDLIDARRTGRAVQVWADFDDFRAYTTRPDKMVPLEEAKEDRLLRCFLKKIRGKGGRLRGRGGRSGAGKRARMGAPSFGLGLDGERESKRPRGEM